MKIQDICDNFSMEVAGCPDETMRQAVARAFQTLCVRGKVWTAWLDDIALIDNVADYTIDPPDNTSLSDQPIELWVGSTQLTPKSVEQLGLDNPGYYLETAPTPVYWNSPVSRDAVRLYPTPLEATMPLRVRGKLIPKLSITSIPDDVALYHQTTLEMGAKGILMRQSKQLWTDLKLGEYWNEKFENAVEFALHKSLSNNSGAPLTARPRSFG